MPRFTRIHRVALLAIAALAVACGGASTPAPVAPAPTSTVAPPPVAPTPTITATAPALPTIPATPQPAPSELMGVATVAAPSALRAAVVAFANTAKPGVGLFIPTLDVLASTAEADLSGVDLDRPAHAVGIDRPNPRDTFVLVVPVADAEALERLVAPTGLRVLVHGDWAAIGTLSALRAAAPYALTSVVNQPATAHLTMRVDAGAARHAFGPLWSQAMEAGLRTLSESERASRVAGHELLAALWEQLDSVEFSMQLVAGRARATLMFHPRPGTKAAAFTAAQRPGDFAAIERLPAGMFAGGGAIDTSLVSDTFRALMVAAKGPASNVPAAFAQWATVGAKAQTLWFGRFAGEWTFASIWSGFSEPDLAGQWRTQLESLLIRGDVRVGKDLGRYRRARLSSHDLGEIPTDAGATLGELVGPVQAAIAITDHEAMIVGGKTPVPLVRRLIDDLSAPRSKTPSPLAATVAEARSRGDSYVLAIDLPQIRAAFGGAPAPPTTTAWSTMSFAAREGALVLHLDVPASQLGPLF